MTELDHLQSFIIEAADVRGEIVRLEESFAEIFADNYPEIIQKLLAETLLAAVLLAASIKFQGTLTIQFHGEGPIRMLVASCNHELQVRGLAKYDEQTLDHEFATAFKQGKLVITIIPDNATKPYQSIIAINGQSIQQCLEFYFQQSEQLLTKFRLVVDQQQAVGILLQQLPVQKPGLNEQFLHLAKQMEQVSITDNEIMEYANVQILQKIYSDYDIRLFDPRQVEFKCSCNIEKMRQAIKVMGEQEAFSLLSTQKTIEVRCEYCNKAQQFDRSDVLTIFNSSNPS